MANAATHFRCCGLRSSEPESRIKRTAWQVLLTLPKSSWMHLPAYHHIMECMCPDSLPESSPVYAELKWEIELSCDKESLYPTRCHRTVPHDNTRDRLHMFCTQAGLKPTTEPANLLRNQETGAISERRPDISVGGLDPQGRLLLLDVTTTDPGCATSLNNGHAATQRGGAAAAAERRKQVAYADWIDPAVQSFMPLAFEMSGRWGSLSSKFFDLVKRTAVERRGYSGLRYQYWAGFWRRSISVGLLRDIAKSALRIRDQLVDHQPIASTFFTDIGHA